MKPYYQNELTTIYNGDCLEVMDYLIKQGIKIDAIITDPPYGTSANKWDLVINPIMMWSRLNKLSKMSTPIVLFGNEPFSSKIRLSNLEMYKYDWKWEKPSGANFLNFKYQPSKVHEDIMVFGNLATSYSKKGNLPYQPQMEIGKPYEQKSGKQKTINSNSTVRSEIKQVVTKNKGERYPRSIQKFKKDKSKYHSTQKPIELLKYLIKTYTKENDLILDFTAGSFTTCVASEQLNRRSIGIELEKKYCDIGIKRLNTLQIKFDI